MYHSTIWFLISFHSNFSIFLFSGPMKTSWESKNCQLLHDPMVILHSTSSYRRSSFSSSVHRYPLLLFHNGAVSVLILRGCWWAAGIIYRTIRGWERKVIQQAGESGELDVDRGWIPQNHNLLSLVWWQWPHQLKRPQNPRDEGWKFNESREVLLSRPLLVASHRPRRHFIDWEGVEVDK